MARDCGEASGLSVAVPRLWKALSVEFHLASSVLPISIEIENAFKQTNFKYVVIFIAVFHS